VRRQELDQIFAREEHRQEIGGGQPVVQEKVWADLPSLPQKR
jgi:hypothetical protein